MLTQEIKLKIHDEAELFSPYDPDGNQLSEDVNSYFARCFLETHEKDRENIVIRIESETPVDRENVKEKVRAHFNREQEVAKRALKKLTYKEICIGIVGLILLSLWYLVKRSTDGLSVEVLSMMAAVAIWEAVGIAFMQRPEADQIKKDFEQLTNAEIYVTDPTTKSKEEKHASQTVSL